jgi:hypothetical protein
MAFGVYVGGKMHLSPMAVQVKMQSVGAGAYDQRVGRVVKARGLLEGQLKQRLVLLGGYSRISSMIEIEVEMNSAVRSCWLTLWDLSSASSGINDDVVTLYCIWKCLCVIYAARPVSCTAVFCVMDPEQVYVAELYVGGGVDLILYASAADRKTCALQVPQSEIDDIESQIKDLMEEEEMQAEWELQAEAQDELERLLRTTSHMACWALGPNNLLASAEFYQYGLLQ